jgi:hypothetical protein
MRAIPASACGIPAEVVMLIFGLHTRNESTETLSMRRSAAWSRHAFSGVLAASGILAAPPIGAVDAAPDNHNHFCSATTTLAFSACKNSVSDEFQLAKAICLNIGDDDERDTCEDAAQQARNDGNSECRDQRDARDDVCDLLGEGRYDPDFNPDLFTDPFANTNVYFPLAVGNTRGYFGGGETVSIEVLDQTKSIAGVTCGVVHDQVTVAGFIIEDTNDWFAQAKDGTVWYCGEETKEYETFDGDNPIVPELVNIDGSFKAGRGGDKAGIAFLGTPETDQAYRQEFSLSNAEDIAQVLSTSYRYGDDAELDRFVPADLANLLCDGDCVVTYETTALEPDAAERKYYSPNIGEFLTVDLVAETTSQLFACNYDPRCASLPPPPPTLSK